MGFISVKEKEADPTYYPCIKTVSLFFRFKENFGLEMHIGEYQVYCQMFLYFMKLTNS